MCFAGRWVCNEVKTAGWRVVCNGVKTADWRVHDIEWFEETVEARVAIADLVNYPLLYDLDGCYKKLCCNTGLRSSEPTPHSTASGSLYRRGVDRIDCIN